MKTNFFQVCLCLLIFGYEGQAQDTNYLQNPSFEDIPAAGKGVFGWETCGPKTETPPDVQPGWFNVKTEAQDGNTYLGLVVRDNDTWESVSQELSETLWKDSLYELRIYLARARLYLSTSKVTGQEANYATPTIFQVWGGHKPCEKKELLASTPVVSNTEWQEFILDLIPKGGNFEYITLEAYYKMPVLFSYNGNLLLDNCSLVQKSAGQK